MDKFSFIGLWDVYSGLLTETQQEITNLYFNLDLTVSEIAKEKGISRQAVSECLKGCKSQLEEYENKLHLFERLQKESLEISFMLTDASRWADRLSAERPELKEEIVKLKEILEKDYSEEVVSALADEEVLKVLSADYTEKVYGRKKDGEE